MTEYTITKMRQLLESKRRDHNIWVRGLWGSHHAYGEGDRRFSTRFGRFLYMHELTVEDIVAEYDVKLSTVFHWTKMVGKTIKKPEHVKIIKDLEKRFNVKLL